MDDTIKLKITQAMKPTTFCVPQDTIVVRDDGSIVILKKGTLITAPFPDGPPTVTSFTTPER